MIFAFCGLLCVIIAVDCSIIHYVRVILHLIANNMERTITGQKGSTP